MVFFVANSYHAFSSGNKRLFAVLEYMGTSENPKSH